MSCDAEDLNLSGESNLPIHEAEQLQTLQSRLQPSLILIEELVFISKRLKCVRSFGHGNSNTADIKQYFRLL
jgi:hypothetical protein